MNEKLLQEYIDRMGIVTPGELTEQTGAASQLWRQHAISLILNKEVFLCRLDHGRETMLSRHLLFCLDAVYNEPELTGGAQDIYDWLTDNGPAGYEAIRAACLAEDQEGDFRSSFLELEHKLCVAPVAVGEGYRDNGAPADGLLGSGVDFIWGTSELWSRDLHKAARYKDLEYCLSEIRRLLRVHFTTREINNLIYHGVL